MRMKAQKSMTFVVCDLCLFAAHRPVGVARPVSLHRHDGNHRHVSRPGHEIPVIDALTWCCGSGACATLVADVATHGGKINCDCRRRKSAHQSRDFASAWRQEIGLLRLPGAQRAAEKKSARARRARLVAPRIRKCIGRKRRRHCSWLAAAAWHACRGRGVIISRRAHELRAKGRRQNRAGEQRPSRNFRVVKPGVSSRASAIFNARRCHRRGILR